MARRHRCLMGVALLALSACGSTLQPTEVATEASPDELQVESGAGDELDVSTVPSGDSSSATSATSVANGSTSGPASAGGQTAGGGAAPGGGPAGSPGTGSGPIKLGVASVDPTALAAVFGVDTSEIDLWAADKALIAHINKNGGVAGRPIEPSLFLADIGADQNVEAQRACEQFTTDDGVDVVVAYSANAVLVSCLGQHNVAVIDPNRFVPDTPLVSRFANWILPDALAVDRYAAEAIKTSLALEILASGDKLGVLYEDCDWGRRVVDSVIAPLASSAGVGLERATTKCIENLVGDLGPVTNQANSAAVRFNSRNVTHVLTLTAAEGFVVGRFSIAADQQNYHPHYILTSNAFPDNNVDPESAVAWDRGALGNMTGIGWLPVQDTGRLPEPTAKTAGQRAACEAAFPDPFQAQYENDSARMDGFAAAYERCDLYFATRDILAGAGGRFDAGSVVASFRKWAPTSVATTGIGAPRSASGVAFVRPFRYDAASNEFVYSGDARPVS